MTDVRHQLGVTAARSFIDCQFSTKKLLKDFVKGDVIGNGAHGIVYKGLYRGKLACLKIGHSQAETQEFRIESEVLFKLDGAGGTPKLIAFALNSPIMIISVCKGQTVYAWQMAGKLTKARIVSALTEITRCLQEIHCKGVVHNDIKSDNILISFSNNDSCSVNIIDLGIAAKPLDRIKLEGVSPENYVNFPHCAPEMYFGEPIHPRSDVFSLGHLAASLLKVAEPGVSCPDINLLVDQMTCHELTSRPTTMKVLSDLKCIALIDQMEGLSLAN